MKQCNKIWTGHLAAALAGLAGGWVVAVMDSFVAALVVGVSIGLYTVWLDDHAEYP